MAMSILWDSRCVLIQEAVLALNLHLCLAGQQEIDISPDMVIGRPISIT